MGRFFNLIYNEIALHFVQCFPPRCACVFFRFGFSPNTKNLIQRTICQPQKRIWESVHVRKLLIRHVFLMKLQLHVFSYEARQKQFV